MNILLLGSDTRSGIGQVEGSRSDTIILVHVDPANNYLSHALLPPGPAGEGGGLTARSKLNAAYAYGGPALTIKTIQQITGVDIDHYLEVDFQAFRDMTDALGGVYVEVDRRYYYNGTALRARSICSPATSCWTATTLSTTCASVTTATWISAAWRDSSAS